MGKVSEAIVEYFEKEIVPQYTLFDKAHRENHVRMVIEQSMKIVEKMPWLNRDMVYVVAAFHDLGLTNGRENHHHDSRKILEADGFVRKSFTADQIKMMGEAVEDHRASNSCRPRNEYGLVVAEADRCIDAETIIRRTVQYGLSRYPEYSRDGHYKRMLSHLKEKYGRGGYLKIWIPWSENARNLEELQEIMGNEATLKDIFDRIFDEESY